ncbi:MAG TPA: hypothetical protein VH170_01620 [Chthoniobacterales bacterium]|jgi:hypothetical protein|nr:hypothetical protein [Chthoniobacterales bacterium]
MRTWNNPDHKKAACIAVLNKISSDETFGAKCLKSEEFAREAFRSVGKIDVPEDAKVVFLPEGDLDKAKRDGAGSLVLEIPPAANGHGNEHAMEYVRCSYVVW